MAATIAIAMGHDKERRKEASRLGSEWASGAANTWETFTTAHVEKNGAGYVRVTRGNHTIQVAFGPEAIGPHPGGLLDDYTIRIDGRVLTLADTEEGA